MHTLWSIGVYQGLTIQCKQRMHGGCAVDADCAVNKLEHAWKLGRDDRWRAACGFLQPHGMKRSGKSWKALEGQPMHREADEVN